MVLLYLEEACFWLLHGCQEQSGANQVPWLFDWPITWQNADNASFGPQHASQPENLR